MPTVNEIREALKDVIDPELGVNIVDLGLVYGIQVDEEAKNVDVKFTLTSPGCPIGPMIMDGIYTAIQRLPGVEKINAAQVWEPPWNPEMMNEEAKDQMGIF